jgi:P-type Cu+ transporter
MTEVLSHHAHAAGVPHSAAPAARSGPYLLPAACGVAAMLALLALYMGTLTLISGWEFTAAEFSRYWYFIVPLALGFGTQFALFMRLRILVGKSKDSGTVVAASGTTSTAAMVSCCAHYLVNVAPVLGATGLVAFAAQFQVELFWVGLAFSAAGVGYVFNKVVKAEREHAKCAD